jgi:Fic family protein
MLNISYNISLRLKEDLYKIESLRRQILLTPISPTTELKLRWEAIFNRIYYSLKLSGNPMKRQDMLKLLSEIAHKKMNSDQLEVIKYKEAQDYISQNWLGSPDPVDAQALIELHKIIGNGKLRVPKAGLQYLLDYLQARLPKPGTGGQAKSENPIIIAGIVNIEMEKMHLFEEKNKLISCLASLLFLYKYGYDFRGFLAYETQWIEDSNKFKENYERSLSAGNITLWLEYFASCILSQLQLVTQSLQKPKSGTLDLRKSFWELQDRQKSILSYLDSPQVTITNRQIQKRYKTSQITASRDLAKLTNLGFLFSHGKGRSVYYTKI